MEDFVLRKYVRKIISEFFNNAWVYTYGPNKFPKFDGSETTPSELDAEADSLFDNHEKFEETVGLEDQFKKSKKKSIFINKH